MLLFLRHVCDTAADYREALDMAKSERLMAGGIITVVGVRNDERAVVERTPTRAAVRSPRGDEPVFATNHHRSLSAPHACPRYDHMATHAHRRPPMEVLTHPEVLQTITAQHVLMCPATQSAEMRVPQHFLATDTIEEHTLIEMLGFFTG
jgi:hypothetical protein